MKDRKSKRLCLIISVAVFLFSAGSTYFFEEYFRKMIRYFFEFSTDENLTFIGKNFHLFPSEEFQIGFGLFCVFLFNVLKTHKLLNILIVAVLFFSVAFGISYVESNMKIIGCTACDDGKFKMHYNAVAYDFIFICSLIISCSPFLFKFIRGLGPKK